MLRLAAALLFMTGSALGITSTNIQDLYNSIGFDHTATNSGVIIQLTDPHFTTRLDDWGQTNWNDPGITNMINTMPRAREQVVMVSGDLGMGNWSYGSITLQSLADFEWRVAKTNISCITNADWIYYGPGNHDADNAYYSTQENPRMQAVFEQPLYTNITVAGMPIIYLNGGDVSYLSPAQSAWLQNLKPQLDKSKQILMMTHQNPWMDTFSGQHQTLTRDICREVEWFMRGWRAPINWVIGHSHGNAYVKFPFDSTNVRLWYGTPSRKYPITEYPPYGWFRSGFMVYCITNGSMCGAIMAIAREEQIFKTVNMQTGAGAENFVEITYPYIQAWEECGNVLWRVEEGSYKRADYEETFSALNDARRFVIYCGYYRVKLPGDKFPSATRALLSTSYSYSLYGSPLTVYPLKIYLGSTLSSLDEYPIAGFTNHIAWIDIPTNLRGAPFWMIASNSFGDPFGIHEFAGFGLGTTNTTTDFQAWCGRELGEYRFDKNTEIHPGLTAWIAFIHGLNIRHMDTTEAIDGYPWLGGWPLRTNDVLLIPTRTNLIYTFQTATTTNGPWSDVTVTNGVWTNGWRQVGIYPAGTNVYKIEASEGPPPPVLTLQKGANGQLIIGYDGLLQSANSPDGPWNDYADAAQSPVTITVGQGAKFFRAARH